jgi:hypothetical protein
MERFFTALAGLFLFMGSVVAQTPIPTLVPGDTAYILDFRSNRSQRPMVAVYRDSGDSTVFWIENMTGGQVRLMFREFNDGWGAREWDSEPSLSGVMILPADRSIKLETYLAVSNLHKKVLTVFYPDNSGGSSISLQFDEGPWWRGEDPTETRPPPRVH